MELDEYQRQALRTARRKDEPDYDLHCEMDLAIAALGLSGETGEVVDRIKKYLGHGHPLDPDKIADELGDVLWYIARIAEWHDLSLSEIAEHNIGKLIKRYPDGFSNERSLARVEEA